jgi:hypothetical protein
MKTTVKSSDDTLMLDLIRKGYGRIGVTESLFEMKFILDISKDPNL